MRQRIELITSEDVNNFINVVDGIDADVILEGFDENGKPWMANAKSSLATFALVGMTNVRKNSINSLDWNTLTCVCEKDIYTQIQKWAVGSQMEG
jgi:hypothetical protein